MSIWLTILVSCVSLGCSNSSELAEIDDQLQINDETFSSVSDIDWFLNRYQRDNNQVNEILDGSNYVFRINSVTNNVTGVFDCNEYTTSYSYDSSVLRFGSLEIDAAICEHNGDVRYEDQNSDVSYLFQNDMYLVKSSDELLVRTNQNDEYVFESQPLQDNSIEDITWNLISYLNDLGIQTSLVPSTSYSFRLDSQSSQASGMFECNAFSADYSLDDMSIQFGELQSDGQDCTLDEQGYQQQTSLIALVLTRSLRTSFERDKLILIDADNNSLVFSKNN